MPAAREIADAVVEIRHECSISPRTNCSCGRKRSRRSGGRRAAQTARFRGWLISAIRSRSCANSITLSGSFGCSSWGGSTKRSPSCGCSTSSSIRRKCSSTSTCGSCRRSLVEIFSRLVDNYQDLTYQKGQRQRRIGIELLGVTRSSAISNRIVELMLRDRANEGVNWIVDEATAWYFV